jgi:hypothetical protein
MPQLIQIGERKIISMDEISEDGYWQSIDGEWVPTEKQLEAINNGAITHDNVIVNQGGRESIHDTFTHPVEDISAESKTLELNKCAACGNPFEGTKARKCAGKKCSNPICLECDPLESSRGKIMEMLGTIVDLISGDLVELVRGKVEGEVENYNARIRCKQCVERNQKEDIILISAALSLFAGFLLMEILNLFISINGCFLYLIGCTISFFVIKKLLHKLYSIVLPHFTPRIKKTIVVIFVVLMVGSWIVNLNQPNDYSDNEIVGQWYSSVETMDFKSDGSVVHSDSSIISWRNEGNDLVLQFEGDSEYEYYYVYQISTPYLFIAPYVDSTTLETISEDDCVVLSSNQNATNESYWEEANIKSPDWCNLE